MGNRKGGVYRFFRVGIDAKKPIKFASYRLLSLLAVKINGFLKKPAVTIVTNSLFRLASAVAWISSAVL